MSRRVVITGFGVLSSIGNNSKEVLCALQENKSGIVFMKKWKDIGCMSQVCGKIKNFDVDQARKNIGLESRYMDVASIYALLSSKEAIEKSGLSRKCFNSEKVGCFVGSGIGDLDPIRRASIRIHCSQNSGGGKGTPYDVTRCMASSCSANIANYYAIRGRSYSISSACATSLHNIGCAYELISDNRCDIAITGGAENESPITALIFDNMRVAISKGFNFEPKKASRPYDKRRDGFVISGGGGIVVVEELEHAKKRGAEIYAEIIGYGATSDGYNIILPHPQGDGAYRSIKQALRFAGCAPEDIDYINTHGTSTQAGDLSEAKAIKKIFGGYNVPLSSTKSLTGHGIGAAGVQELIYCILMLQNNFIAASINIDERDPEFNDLNIVIENRDAKLNKILTNSFGFGGTNASMVIKKYEN